MKKLLLFILILSSYCCNAQNYQCLQSGVKHYFTNGNGYLRGIRIDSVRTMGDTTVYYPFHTPRGDYHTSDTLNPDGGSWLGGKVLQLSDGTFIFDDDWSDSVIIKTQASLTDNWVFYRDTSNLYYLATVVSIDTMTFAGFFDTVKTIQINAYNGTVLVTSDPVNGFQILLSKNHGFVQVFDLYTFPYHLPSAVYTSGLDYYLDNCVNYLSAMQPNQSNSVFNLITFINPTMKQLYNWNVGDVYEYGNCLPTLSDLYCDPVMQYLLDTVKIKDTSAYITGYICSGLESNLTNGNAFGIIGPPPYYYATMAYNGSAGFDTTLLINTAIMPEEYGQTNFYYYAPNDTSYCMESTVYESIGNNLTGAVYTPVFELSDPITSYKMNLGLIYFNQISYDDGGQVTSTQLIYYYRNGESCDDFVNLLGLPTNVQNVIKENTITIFPNPATTSLTIQSTNQPINEIQITNIIGQTVISMQPAVGGVQTVDVSALPGGVYFVKVNNTAVQKFIKE